MLNNKALITESMKNSDFQNRMAQVRPLVEKFTRYGYLGGITDKFELGNTAQLLENQLRTVITENQTGIVANAEQWSGVTLPIVKRLWGEIPAKDFVSVQAMSQASGLVFWLDFKFNTARPGYSTTNSSEVPTEAGYQTNSVFGTTITDGNPFGGMYGEGRFGYSLNVASTSFSASGSFTPTGTSASIAALTMAANANAEDFNWNTSFTDTYSASIAAGHFKKVTVAISSLTDPDKEGVRSFVLTGSGIATQFPQFTKNINDTTLVFVVSGSISTTAAASSVGVQYSKQTTAAFRGDFEDRGTNDLGIPEIRVEMRSEPIVAKTRKLKTSWTPEFAQDLQNYHAIGAEEVVTDTLYTQMELETNAEILSMLKQNAVTTRYWSAQVGKVFNRATRQFEDEAVNRTAYVQGTWFQTLGTVMQDVSNNIHAKTARSGANFAVCSPAVATILESIPGYAADTNGEKAQFQMGVQKVGLLNNRFTIYKNPYQTTNEILMGYRGSNFLETGAVYCPYIPVMTTPLIYDPVNFTPNKGIMTRYAKKVVRPEFYGLVYVHGLPTVGF